MDLLAAASCVFVFIEFQVPAGSKELCSLNGSPTFINIPSHSQLLAEMMQSHMVKDMCLIGSKVSAILSNMHTSSAEEVFSDINGRYFVISRVVANL